MTTTPAPKRTHLWFLLQAAKNARQYAERSNQPEVAEAFADVEHYIEDRMPVVLTHYTGPGSRA